MNGARWPGRQILDILAAEPGASFEELSARLGVPYPEVKSIVWRLFGARRVDVCAGSVVLPPVREGRRAA